LFSLHIIFQKKYMQAKKSSSSSRNAPRKQAQGDLVRPMRSREVLKPDVKPIYKAPTAPSDDLGLKFFGILKDFIEDESKKEYEFSSELDSSDRKRIHSLADEFGLEHTSQGDEVRTIIVRKNPSISKKSDHVWKYGGYVGLFGPSIDAAGNTDVESVPPADIAQRLKRDGNVNHITFMLNNELKQAVSNSLSKIKALSANPSEALSDREWVFNYIAANVVDDWIDMGLGTIKHSDNEAWFKVLRWKSADDAREFLGLTKKDFHITVGFRTADIHNESKGEKTLLPQFLFKNLSLKETS